MEMVFLGFKPHLQELFTELGVKEQAGDNVKGGDHTITWNMQDRLQVNEARKTFQKMVQEKGYLAFKESASGQKGSRITEFDPDAERVLFVKPLAGG